MTVQNQKARATLILDKNIIKQIKRVALEKETTQTEMINDYLQKCLNNEKVLKTHEEMTKSTSSINLREKDNYEIEDIIGMINERQTQSCKI
jgi:hypothetical protein